MPDPISAFLKDLLQLPGLPGHEAPVRRRVEAEWTALADEISVSRLGSLHALKRGSGPSPRPSVMLAAHMDAIGLMVTEVTGGFLRLTAMGGVDPRILPGQPVLVHGRRELPGLVVQAPAACLPQGGTDRPMPLEHLLVDVGLPASMVSRRVRPGDLVSFAQPPMELGEDLIAGHSLDNRASLAALTVCLQELQQRQHVWDVMAVATAQEELTLGGAQTSGFALRPDVAVAIDVTYGRGLGQPEHRTYPLRGGPTNIWGPDIHPGVHKAIEAAAQRIDVRLTVELCPDYSGTDAHSMQVAAEGVPTGAVSVPLRYMHTPLEVVAIPDIRGAGCLLAEFVAGLESDFLDRLSWD